MPQNYTEEYSALSTFFKTAWGNKAPLMVENDSNQPQPNVAWVRFALRGAVSTQVSVGTPGSNYIRYPGTILVQVFTPLATGDAPGRNLADEAAEIFEGAKIEGFDIGFPHLSTAEKPNEDGWYQINVTIPFTRNSYK